DGGDYGEHVGRVGRPVAGQVTEAERATGAQLRPRVAGRLGPGQRPPGQLGTGLRVAEGEPDVAGDRADERVVEGQLVGGGRGEVDVRERVGEPSRAQLHPGERPQQVRPRRVVAALRGGLDAGADRGDRLVEAPRVAEEDR